MSKHLRRENQAPRVKCGLSECAIFRNGVGTSSPPYPLWLSDPAVGEPPQNQKHVFELGSGKVCFDRLYPKVNALLSSNVWVIVTIRLSKQTQPQGSIEIVHAR